MQASEAKRAAARPASAGTIAPVVTGLASVSALNIGIDGAALHASAALGADAKPVRAILFDKTPKTNWSLGWHQDRTIVVRERQDVPGFGPWTSKGGLQHVEPPFAVIASMLTLRIHLDDVPADNAPLIIATGSHRLGKITKDKIATTVGRLAQRSCIARRGDIWSYATAILHASAAATGARHRRVLQVDYGAIDLPPPLAWLGI